MKSLKSPVSMVINVMGMVAVMLGMKSDWDSVRKMISNPKQLEASLRGYDKNNLSDKLYNRLGAFLQKDDMTVDKAK